MASFVDTYLDRQLARAEATPWMTADLDPEPDLCSVCADHGDMVEAVRMCGACGDPLCAHHTRRGLCPQCFDLQFGAEAEEGAIWIWIFDDGSSCGHDHPSEDAARDCTEVRECAAHRHMGRRLVSLR